MQRRDRKGVFINSSLLVERRVLLQQLQKKRDALLARLNELLEEQQVHVAQQVQLQDARTQCREEEARQARARAELSRAKSKLVSTRKALDTRRAAVEGRVDALARTRAASTYILPQDLRTHELALLHARLGLAADQRQKTSQLLDILPLKVTSIRSGAVAPGAAVPTNSAISISLCGLKLTDTLLSPGALQQPQALSAVLGYMLLLLELLACYVGGPQLHEGSFQGSTTVLWQQQSFWNRRPSSSAGVLPLFVEETLVGSAVGSALPALPRRENRTGASWAMQTLVRAATGAASAAASSAAASATTSPPAAAAQGGKPGLGAGLSLSPGAGGGGGGGTGGPSLGRRHSDLVMAFEMLLRSISCLVRDRSGDYEGLGQLPHSWSPFGWLVMLCSAIMQDDSSEKPKLGGVIAAASLCVQAEQEAAAAGAPEPGIPGLEDDEGGAAEEEGWDVVRPILPPPPSADDEEVAQYARALFSDGNATAGAGSGGGGGGSAGQGPPSGLGPASAAAALLGLGGGQAGGGGMPARSGSSSGSSSFRGPSGGALGASSGGSLANGPGGLGTSVGSVTSRLGSLLRGGRA